jgi:hypothetical protein
MTDSVTKGIEKPRSVDAAQHLIDPAVALWLPLGPTYYRADRFFAGTLVNNSLNFWDRMLQSELPIPDPC